MIISRERAKRIIQDAQFYLDEIEFQLHDVLSGGQVLQVGCFVCYDNDPAVIAREFVIQTKYIVERMVLAQLGQARRDDRMLKKGAKPHEPEEPMTRGQIEGLEQNYGRV